MTADRTTVILSTDSGIVALDSPVKIKILELLESGITSFEELVEKSLKAKSTVSVHLHDLKELNLIQEKASPNDRRKKYFVLNAIYLAYSQMPLRKQYNRQMDAISTSKLNGSSFKEKLFGTFRYGMEAYGIDPKPILKTLGNDIGAKISIEIDSHDGESTLSELSAFWREHRLGNMTYTEGDKTEISVTDCYHCGKMPNVGKTLCSMDEGIIEGVLFTKLNCVCHVKEIECYGAGNGHCKFIVDGLEL